MLENSSVELKTLVLLDFTKRLIISKNPMEFLIKQEPPKTKSHEFVEKVKQRIPEEIKKEIYFKSSRDGFCSKGSLFVKNKEISRYKLLKNG